MMITEMNQILPRISYGDATSCQAIEIRNYLKAKGMNSTIYVNDIDEKMNGEAKLLSEEKPGKGTPLIYHHSIGSEVANMAMHHEGIKICIYHNITPCHFFRNYNPILYHYTKQGREQLDMIRDSVNISFGDSEYNCRELKDRGFKNVNLLPIIVNPSKWDIDHDPSIIERYDGHNTKNIIFVGRIAPNKCQKDLVRFFYFFNQIIPDSRLFLVGSYKERERYFQEVAFEIKRLDLENKVILSGHVSDAELKSYYLVSDLFLSFSEHEGFGVPLIEAMWFDIPVLAYKSSAVPETLGDAAFMFTDKRDLKKIALLAKHILDDSEVSNSILETQQRRRSYFTSENIQPFLENLLMRIRQDETTFSGKKTERPEMLKVCFVVQRYGEGVNGGAELLCREIAEKMTKYWDVNVVTTCAVDHVTWQDFYLPGIEYLKKVKIHRFQVDQPRSPQKFGRISRLLQSRGIENCSKEEQEEWIKEQGPYSTELIKFIKENKQNYDLFVFFTYLYSTTYFGLPEVSDKVCLVPTAHDEWTINFPIYHRLFSKPAGFVFNTPEEKNFLKRKFPDLSFEGIVSGVGICKPGDIDEERFRKSIKISEPFILYLGRIEEAKGCPILFDHFQKFKKDHPSDLKLVLAGKSSMDIPEHPDIIHLGFVEEQTKWDTLAACRLLVNPSKYESLSMVLLEAWTLGKPVLVNEECEVLKNQTKRANGGKSFSNYPSFVSGLLTILDDEVELQEAKDFVSRNYSWEKIERDYLEMANNVIKSHNQ